MRQIPKKQKGEGPATTAPVLMGTGGAQLGQTVRRLREERGLSMRELARRAGCSTQYVSYLEQGHCVMPSLIKLGGLAAGLHLPLVVFLREMGLDPLDGDPASVQAMQIWRICAALSAEGRAELLRYARYRLSLEHDGQEPHTASPVS